MLVVVTLLVVPLAPAIGPVESLMGGITPPPLWCPEVIVPFPSYTTITTITHTHTSQHPPTQILKEVKLDAMSPNLLVGASTCDDAAV